MYNFYLHFMVYFIISPFVNHSCPLSCSYHHILLLPVCHSLFHFEKYFSRVFFLHFFHYVKPFSTYHSFLCLFYRIYTPIFLKWSAMTTKSPEILKLGSIFPKHNKWDIHKLKSITKLIEQGSQLLSAFNNYVCSFWLYPMQKKKKKLRSELVT